MVGYYEEGRSMLTPGLFFSKSKKTAQNRKTTSVQVLAPLTERYAVSRFGAVYRTSSSRAHSSATHSVRPRALESLVQNLPQSEEMADIGGGIFESLGGERTPPPVSSLEPLALRDSYAQQVFDEGC